MGKHIRELVLLMAVLGLAASLPALAQQRRPPQQVQSKDRLHEMAKKSGGHYVLRYRPNRSTLYPNVEELAKRSDLIVVGRTLGHQPSLRPDGNFITEDFLVKVHEVIKGELPAGKSILVSLPGGSHRFPDGTSATVIPVSQQQAQDSGIYVFFLKSKKNAAFKGHLLASETQGLFALTSGKVQPADQVSDDPIVVKYRNMGAADFLGQIHKAVPRKKK